MEFLEYVVMRAVETCGAMDTLLALCLVLLQLHLSMCRMIPSQTEDSIENIRSYLPKTKKELKQLLLPLLDDIGVENYDHRDSIQLIPYSRVKQRDTVKKGKPLEVAIHRKKKTNTAPLTIILAKLQSDKHNVNKIYNPDVPLGKNSKHQGGKRFTIVPAKGEDLGRVILESDKISDNNQVKGASIKNNVRNDLNLALIHDKSVKQPVDVTVEVTSEVTGEISSLEMTTEVTNEVTSEATDEVTSDVNEGTKEIELEHFKGKNEKSSNEDISDVTSEVSSEVTEENIANEVTKLRGTIRRGKYEKQPKKIITDITDEVISEITTEVTSEDTSVIVEDVPEKNNQVKIKNIKVGATQVSKAGTSDVTDEDMTKDFTEMAAEKNLRERNKKARSRKNKGEVTHVINNELNGKTYYVVKATRTPKKIRVKPKTVKVVTSEDVTPELTTKVTKAGQKAVTGKVGKRIRVIPFRGKFIEGTKKDRIGKLRKMSQQIITQLSDEVIDADTSEATSKVIGKMKEKLKGGAKKRDKKFRGETKEISKKIISVGDDESITSKKTPENKNVVGRNNKVKNGYVGGNTKRIINNIVTKEIQYVADVTNEATSEVTSEVTEDITSDETEGVTSKINQEVTSEVTQEVTSEVTQDVASESSQEVTSEVSQDVTSELSQEVTREISQDVTSELYQEDNSEVTQDVTSELSQEVTSEVTHDVTIELSQDVLSQEVTSEVTQAVTSELYQEFTSEVTQDVTDEVSEENTSELNQDVTTELFQEVTSEVTRDVTSELSREVTSKVTQDVTSELSQVLTSEVIQDVISESSQEMTSEVTQDVTSELSQEVTGEVSQDLTSELSQQVTSEVTQDFTSELSQEVTGEVNQGVTSDLFQEVTSEVNEEVTSEITHDVTSELIQDITNDSPLIGRGETSKKLNNAIGYPDEIVGKLDNIYFRESNEVANEVNYVKENYLRDVLDEATPGADEIFQIIDVTASEADLINAEIVKNRYCDKDTPTTHEVHKNYNLSFLFNKK